MVLSLRSWEPVYGMDVMLRGFARAAEVRHELRLIVIGRRFSGGNGPPDHPGAGLLNRVYLGGQVNQSQPAGNLPGSGSLSERLAQRWLFGLLDGSAGLAACLFW